MAEPTLKQQVYDAILGSILSREFPMHAFLKEGELASRYQVSKAPVREALIQLCNENIIRNYPRAGYQIIPLTPKDIREATQIRLFLELSAIRLSLPTLTEDNLETLHQLNSDIYATGSCRDTLRTWWDKNRDFHLRLSSFAGNSLMQDTLERMFSILWRAIVQIFSDDNPDLFRHHSEDNHVVLEDALRRKDQQAVAAILTRDINSIPSGFHATSTLSNP